MTSETAVPAPAWNSLADMKCEHRTLLGNPDRSGRESTTREAVRRFILEGSALGARLSSLDDRVEAQRMLDYWAAVNTGAGSGEGGTLKAVLVDYEDVGEQKAGDKAERLYQGASPHGRTILKRLFLGMIALEENGTSFQLVPRTAEELTAKIAAAAGEKLPAEWLDQLVSTGVVKLYGEGRYTLVGPSVMDHWETAIVWMDQRRRLRGAARFWKEHDEDPSALLEAGDLLDEADGYLDLTPQERKFVEDSKSAGEQKRKLRAKFKVIASGLIAGLIGCVIALFILKEARDASQKAADANKYAAERLYKAEIQLKKAGDQLLLAKTEKKEAEEKLATAVTNRQDAEQKLAAAEELRKRAEEMMTQAKIEKEQFVTLGQNRETSQAERLEKLASEFDHISVQSLVLQPVLREKIAEFRDKLIAETQNPQTPTAYSGQPASDGFKPSLQPGSGILIQAHDEVANQATVGVFVRKDGDPHTYLLMPGYLLSAKSPSDIHQVRSLLDEAKAENLAFTASARKNYGPNAPLEIAAVPVENPAAHLEIQNITTNGQTIIGVASPNELLANQEVTMIGSHAGSKTGVISGYNAKSQSIYTNLPFNVGDAGSVVLTKDNKLVGILFSIDPLNPKQSMVKAAAPFLKQGGFVLTGDATPSQPAPDKTEWAGVMGEILVSGRLPEYVEKAKTYVDLLQQAGIVMPIPAAQPRKRVPSKTEVRYFHDTAEDKDKAKDILKLLSGKGKIPVTQIRLSFVDDPTAPSKFIQISMAESLFDKPSTKPIPKR